MIGLVGKLTEGDGFGIRKHYVDMFRQWGSVLVLDALSKEEFEGLRPALDLLVLPGGADVATYRYDAIPGLFTQKADQHLEHADLTLLPWAIEMGLPVFGICRGFQALQVHFGGGLEQDNSFYHPQSVDYDHLCHKVKLLNVGKPHLMGVNSRHHQSVVELAAPLVPLAIDEKSNIVEAFRHKELPVAAVQWHPEMLPQMRWVVDLVNSLLSA